nr:MAG TPA_asm: hypothetical protein [Caudoviricetes sp.]
MVFYIENRTESLLFIGFRVIYVVPKKQGGTHDEN